MSTATALTIHSGPLKLPVVCYPTVHSELETDSLTGSDIPGQSVLTSSLCHHLYLFHSSRARLISFLLFHQ